MSLFTKLIRWWRGEAEPAERAEAERVKEERDLLRAKEAFERGTSQRPGGV